MKLQLVTLLSIFVCAAVSCTEHNNQSSPDGTFQGDITTPTVNGKPVTEKAPHTLTTAHDAEDAQSMPATRELITKTDPSTKWVSIILSQGDEQSVLHEFKARQNVYDMAVSPDGNYGYTWHDEYNPRKLNIFDLDKQIKKTLSCLV